MPPLLTCHGLTKSMRQRVLFRDLAFGIDVGARVGLIGRNGTGKTTLLRVLAGVEPPDAGAVTLAGGTRIGMLGQRMNEAPERSALDVVTSCRPDILSLLDRHHHLCHQLEHKADAAVQEELTGVIHDLDHQDGWSFEHRARHFLQRMGIDDPAVRLGQLSGGQKRRVDMARLLLEDPDLLLLDEPTNHLDTDIIEWLEDYLLSRRGALLVVTHDRYFLEDVCETIVELNDQRLTHYPGNYGKYLELKATAHDIALATAQHQRAKQRQDLEWLARGAPAQRTQQKSRKKWILEQSSLSLPEEEKRIKIEIGATYLGSKIIEAVNTRVDAGHRTLFSDFTYHAAKGDRIGIVGANGCGKTTLLRMLLGWIEPSTGTVKLGETINPGFLLQEDEELDPEQTLIGALRDIAEYIDTGVGRDRYLSARDLLLRFQFPAAQHGAFVRTLSGGERRRLTLLRVLMRNPNVLLLDEPTNDFDIVTIEALERYLSHFRGTLLIVSHDRAFLDRTVSRIWAFEPPHIVEYPGDYSWYLEHRAGKSALLSPPPSSSAPSPSSAVRRPPKALSYKEEKELHALELLLARIDEERHAIAAQLHDPGDLPYDAIAELGARHLALEHESEQTLLRWMELEEKRTLPPSSP